MCNYISMLSEAQELEEYFGAEYSGRPYHREFRVNGFANPLVPVILDENSSIITSAEWGLLPVWAKERSFQKKTLNARIETAEILSSFKNSTHKRCLILTNGFHEWRWQDSTGKHKEQYLIKVKEEKITALGGLYSFWKDPETGKEICTVTVVTTAANELMAKIHNTKQRMPVLLNRPMQSRWLSDFKLQNFAFPNYEADLDAEVVNTGGQLQLF